MPLSINFIDKENSELDGWSAYLEAVPRIGDTIWYNNVAWTIINVFWELGPAEPTYSSPLRQQAITIEVEEM